MVTLWLLSTDNLNRPAAELAPLLTIIENTVADLAETRRWRINPVGSPDLLPAETARKLKESADATAGVKGMVVNVAVGYGGRQEITDAVRSLLVAHAANGTSIEELAESLQVEHIAEHLYTKGQPDPDLVIRTSGEQRLSGSCSGRARTASSTSARRTGRTSGTSTSSAPCARTRSATAGSGPEAATHQGDSRHRRRRPAPRGVSRTAEVAVNSGRHASGLRTTGRLWSYRRQ